MNYPKIGQTCHAARTEQKHEGENALHTMEFQGYNHDIDSKQEENTMALQIINPALDLSVVQPGKPILDGQVLPFKNVSSEQEASQELSVEEKAYELANQAVKSQNPQKRLEYLKSYISKNPNEAEPLAGYLKLVERLVMEQNGDFSEPITKYGCLIHFQTMSEDEFIEELKPLRLSDPGLQMPEEERRAAYRAIMALKVPELPNDEKSELYGWGNTKTPTLKKLFDELGEPAGELLFYYGCEIGSYDVFEDADCVAEEVLENLLELKPDLVQAVSRTLLKAVDNVPPVTPQENRGIARFRNRRGFITLSWGGDYELLTGLRAMDYQELVEFAQEHGIQPDDNLFSFHQKLKQWNLPIKALPESSEPPIVIMPEAFELFEAFTREEDEHFEKLADIFIRLPDATEEAPIHNLSMLNQCLDWLCDEDLLQLKAAIEAKLETPTQTLPSEDEPVADENEPLNVQIAKAISHPKHYQRRHDYLKGLGQENTEYGIWLNKLVNEYYHQDYSEPATEWGVIQRIKSMSLGDFLKAVNQIADRRNAEIQKNFPGADIQNLYEQIQQVHLTEEHRTEFYKNHGAKGYLEEFISSVNQLAGREGMIFEDYRDSIVSDWYNIDSPTHHDASIPGFVEDMLEIPPDILSLTVEELFRHRRLLIAS